MNSIDQQQPEETRDHLQGQQAIDRIREMAKDAESCFFCTALSLSETGATRPMSVQEAGERGRLWILSPSDSAKNRELQQNAAVCSARCRPIRPPAAGRRWLKPMNAMFGVLTEPFKVVGLVFGLWHDVEA